MANNEAQTNDKMAGEHSGSPSAAATERLVERFGGARAMAAKLDLPIATVQGWQKRGAVPVDSHNDILSAAEKYAISLETIELAATEPAGTGGVAAASSRGGLASKSRLSTGAWIGLGIAPLATVAILLTFCGLYIVKQKTADLSHRVNELTEQNSRLETRLTRLEGLQLGPIPAGTQASATQPGDESLQIAALSQKMQDMQVSNGGQSVLGQTVGGLQQTLATLQTNVQGLSQSLDATKAKVGELDTALTTRRAENAQQFAILLSLDQLRLAALTSQPFDSELSAARTVAHDDPDVGPALNSIARYAADGVPTLNELRAEFNDRASEIVRSNVVGDGHSWYRQALYRLASVISVRKVSTAPNDRDTPEHDVAKAESKLEEDDLAGAVAALKTLTGLPQDVAAGWIDAANSRLAVDAALASLSEVSVARLQAFQTAQGAKP